MPRARAYVLPFALAALLIPVSRASADLVLNEILYDPEGLDEGKEFVEIWNSDSTAVSLAGILVEAGDDSRPGVWTPIYRGVAQDSVPARGAYLIAGDALLDAIQNGPDAVRLSRDGVGLDLVGYGALTSAGLFEGAPAVDAPSGASLARTRDGRDTGSNAADWEPEPDPTPGRSNHPDVRLSIARGGARPDPEVPWPGDMIHVRAMVRNSGLREIAAARWRMEATLRAAPESGAGTWPSTPSGVAAGRTLLSGDSAAITCAVTAPGAGRFDLRVLLRDLDSVPAITDTVTISSRSTAGAFVVNEIAFRDRGAGEWVELIAREDVRDVGLFAISDQSGRICAIDGGTTPRSVKAGAILVLAQDPLAVRAAYGLQESLVFGCRGGWPALNDTNGDDGLADRVRIVDSLGVPSDVVPYRSDDAQRGGSIERLGTDLPSASPGSWSETIDPRAGTPGRPNSLRAPRPADGGGEGLLFASTRILRQKGATAAPVVLAFGGGARGRRVRVLVHDLLGRTRRRLIDGQRIGGALAFSWDGRDDGGEPVRTGAYVVRAETIPDGSEPMTSANLALTVVDR